VKVNLDCQVLTIIEVLQELKDKNDIQVEKEKRKRKLKSIK